jgi:hypothetical protein
MNQPPLPLADPPRPTARPPEPRPTEDHRTHLSGGARYAICNRSRPAAAHASGRGFDRARSQREYRVEGRR